MTGAPSLTAEEHVAAFRAGELSPVEAAVTVLDRVDTLDDRLGAFCLVDRERTLAEAAASEQRWRAGRPAGRLDGVPVAVKDVFLTRGWPTLRGSRAVDPRGPWDDDAPAVAALRRSGAVLAGKTTTPELGWKAVTDSPLCGSTRNPWAPDRTSGGSSGGSAAALAAGMVPLALGTDGGGSIRIPCAFCGVAGLKPTYGRVPTWPPSPFGLLSHAGPMARTVVDLALLMDVIAAPGDRDPGAWPPGTGRFRDALDRGVTDLRIGFSADLGYVDVEPEVAAIVGNAVDRFRALGAHVEAVDPGFADPREIFDTLWSAGAGRGVADLGVDASILDPGLAELAGNGQRIAILDYLAAMRRREELCARMACFHRQWDLLVTPTLPLAAFAVGHDVPPASGMRGWPSWTPFTYPFNLTQQPAASVPCGFTTAGLPVGLQIVGRRDADGQVLMAAHAIEAALRQPTLAPPTPERGAH